MDRLPEVRTVRRFDDVFTAPHFGFEDAEDYYHRASAMRVIDAIGIPTLIVAAGDDPFVPPEPFLDARVTGNPHITLELSEHGGHCAFLGPAPPDDYWAEWRVTEFAKDVRAAWLRRPDQSPALRA
jgi:predicted alpha/beta-fold hydrolase